MLESEQSQAPLPILLIECEYTKGDIAELTQAIHTAGFSIALLISLIHAENMENTFGTLTKTDASSEISM
uniref:Uncharacterized protein n=1 Tax=Ditylenchus dipsaci TaxID=166011 RepID=A0A915DX58_9BILA